MARPSAEIRSVCGDKNSDEEARQHDGVLCPQTTPNADGGKHAWLFLMAFCVVEAVIFGFAFSFGVFQDYYSSHAPFAGSGNIAVVGAVGQGTLYLDAPFVMVICRFFPRHARWFTPAGLTFAALALAMTSFCETVPGLIGTQGVLFGVGGCFAFCPCLQYIDEWFNERKGMAFGIASSAAGIGGVVIPMMLQALFDSVGFRTTMRVWAGVLFIVATPLAIGFIRPKLFHVTTTHIQPLNLKYIFSTTFGLYWAANFVHALGYFLPSIYLPTYARDVYGASRFLSALTVIVLNISAACGCVAFGFMTDRLAVTTCAAISAIGASIAVLLVWGLSTQLALLYVFSFLYGLFAGGWTSIYPGIMRVVTKKGESAGYGHADPTSLIGCLLLGRGIGMIISGPLSEALISGAPWRGHAVGGFGTGYGVLVTFSGITGFASGLLYPLKWFGVL